MRQFDVVETDKLDLSGHVDSTLLECSERANRHQVVAGEDGAER